MGPRSTFHVLPGVRGWEVRKAGSAGPLGVYEERERAVERGRKEAIRAYHAKLTVHNRDYSVAEVFDYWYDQADQ